MTESRFNEIDTPEAREGRFVDKPTPGRDETAGVALRTQVACDPRRTAHERQVALGTPHYQDLEWDELNRRANDLRRELQEVNARHDELARTRTVRIERWVREQIPPDYQDWSDEDAALVWDNCSPGSVLTTKLRRWTESLAPEARWLAMSQHPGSGVTLTLRSGQEHRSSRRRGSTDPGTPPPYPDRHQRRSGS